MIYLCGRACATAIGNLITLAHELQHFSQYGRNRAVRETTLSKPWYLPSEREAMIASKRVAEGLFGRDAVARFAETRIVAGDDPQRWEFFLTLSASETLNFDE